MPWSGSGTYSLPPAFSPEVNGTVIDATRYNGLTSDVATGITAALAKNGENVPTANLPMGGFKHTGAADANAAGQYLTYGSAVAFGFPAGTAANPGLFVVGDANTGFYSTGADILGVATGGVARITVSAAGVVTVSAPTAGIAVNVTGFAGSHVQKWNGAAAAAASMYLSAVAGQAAFLRIGGNALDGAGFDLQQDGAGAVDIVQRSNLRMSFYTNALERMQIGAAGNIVLVAPTSGTLLSGTGLSGNYSWAFAGGGGGELRYGYNVGIRANAENLITTGTNTLAFGTSGAAGIAFYSNSVERAILGSAGNWTFNAPSAGNTITVGQIAGAAAIDVNASLSGGTTSMGSQNTSNTANSHAQVYTLVAGTSGGDPFFSALITGGQNWSFGARNADSDSFYFANSSTLGSNLRFAITTDGRLYGTALHNNAGAVTGPTNQYIASGTYTPTRTAVANVASSSAFGEAIWIRVGNVVTVSGGVGIDPTAAGGTITTLGLSLPIASTLGTSSNAMGCASDAATPTNGAGTISADTVNNRAQLTFFAADTASHTWTFVFQYLIS
jgi:hypothetical protein